MIELRLPRLYAPPVTKKVGWLVSADALLGPYLWGDGNLKEMSYLFDSYEEAIFASADYYHNAGTLYPYQDELVAVCKKGNRLKHNETVESKVMEFV